jgi:hypothetical protein
MSEDGKGLRVKGKISALDTDHGKRIRALMLDGALGGLSIAYSVPKGGTVYGDGKKADEPRRTLRTVNLASVDIVRDPANDGARIDQVKTLLTLVDHATASKAVAAAIALHSATTVGNDSPTAEERAQLLAHLQEAHRALTGQSMPAGMKALPLTLREFEALIREMTGASNTLARAIAARVEGTATSGRGTRRPLRRLSPSLRIQSAASSRCPEPRVPVTRKRMSEKPKGKTRRGPGRPPTTGIGKLIGVH